MVGVVSEVVVGVAELLAGAESDCALAARAKTPAIAKDVKRILNDVVVMFVD
jgi:hypothetical protein